MVAFDGLQPYDPPVFRLSMLISPLFLSGMLMMMQFVLSSGHSSILLFNLMTWSSLTVRNIPLSEGGTMSDVFMCTLATGIL